MLERCEEVRFMLVLCSPDDLRAMRHAPEYLYCTSAWRQGRTTRQARQSRDAGVLFSMDLAYIVRRVRYARMLPVARGSAPSTTSARRLPAASLGDEQQCGSCKPICKECIHLHTMAKREVGLPVRERTMMDHDGAGTNHRMLGLLHQLRDGGEVWPA